MDDLTLLVNYIFLFASTNGSDCALFLLLKLNQKLINSVCLCEGRKDNWGEKLVDSRLKREMVVSGS